MLGVLLSSKFRISEGFTKDPFFFNKTLCENFHKIQNNTVLSCVDDQWMDFIQPCDHLSWWKLPFFLDPSGNDAIWWTDLSGLHPKKPREDSPGKFRKSRKSRNPDPLQNGQISHATFRLFTQFEHLFTPDKKRDFAWKSSWFSKVV